MATMTEPEQICIPALPLSQPIGEFYIGVMPASELVRISHVDIRRLERELDDYMGIQRRLSPSRSIELEQYVNSSDACFPTAVILAVAEENAIWDEANGQLILFESKETPLEEVALIIDGQHRIDGLKNLEGNKFDVNVSIFIGADMALLANIFATVNLAQTKVNRSLVYDLYSYAHKRSPQKSCHDIAVALDIYERSPFFERIKRLGTATPGRKNEVLTQAAVVDSLIGYLSDNPLRDRDTFLRNLFPDKATGAQLEKLIFRNLWWAKGEDEIAKILLRYFEAVMRKWPASWHDFQTKGNVLPKTNGFRALMRFLRPAYLRIVGKNIGDVPSQSDFDNIFVPVAIKDEHFNISIFPPGTSGEARLFKVLNQSLDGKSDFLNSLLAEAGDLDIADE